MTDAGGGALASPRRWPLSRIVGVALMILLLFSVAAVVAGALTLVAVQNGRDHVVGVIDPAAIQIQMLSTALVDQETGVRGYALSAQTDFLAPYTEGLAAQKSAIENMQAVSTRLPSAAAADLGGVITLARQWQQHYAQPTIDQVARSGKPLVSGVDIATGKADFDALRAQVATLQADITRARAQAVAALDNSASELNGVFIAVAAGLAAIVVLLAAGLRSTAIRPVHRLAAEARRVADGDFEHEVRLTGPREVAELAADVNRMRERILAALADTRQANVFLQEHARELERSNAELEQFAYVASHDLQEPLRKVAGFTQLLQRRYGGQLDERADQYIEFAVDGAQRMQALINDLLQYSRVGRSGREPTLISSDAAMTLARNNLAELLEDTGGTVQAGHLPLVLGELPLLTVVFQNLLGNSLKFSGDKAPRVVITVTADGPSWLFSFADNGIGIEPEYAERIFVIFQRLHDRSIYAGTGIGLAMTRKIIEYFDGKIWLDTTYTGGARFRFTLPRPTETIEATPAEREDEEADD